jgi:hypothetical protein
MRVAMGSVVPSGGGDVDFVQIDFPPILIVRRHRAGRHNCALETARVSYNDPEYLKTRHAVPVDLVKNIAGVGTLVQEVVK